MRVTNQVLIRYLEIKEQIKQLELEEKVIKESIIEAGGIESQDYLASVTERSRTQMASVDECSKALGRETLVEHGLIKTHKYLQVDVKPRAKMVKS